jgi:long-chain acyl-CoA synthetase
MRRAHLKRGAREARPAILLTGVTGFVGQELLSQLLSETAAEITCLIRADDAAMANARLRAIISHLYGRVTHGEVRGRVQAVAGDITRPDLGLDRATRARLIRRTTHVLHGAASVRFDMPLAEARSINVEGTRRMLDLAVTARKHGRLERFGYISTAFVGGSHPGWFGENDLDLGQRFRNTYERSKFEAELMIRGYMRDVPITVLRPSIVVGHSQSGATRAFNVVYWPLRLYADGILAYAPATADLPVDLVPVDFVARGAVKALLEGEPNETYALAAGDRATSAGVIGAMAARVFATRPPRFVTSPLERAVVPRLARVLSFAPRIRFASAVRQYLPYFERGSLFDTRCADALLRPRGIEPPPVGEFLEPVLEFARSTDFGRDRAAIAAREQALRRGRRRALMQTKRHVLASQLDGS